MRAWCLFACARRPARDFYAFHRHSPTHTHKHTTHRYALIALGILSWGAALLFFTAFRQADNGGTAAESLELNGPCMLFGFFDAHDLWHFLSAFGCFFVMWFVLIIDDDIKDKRSKDIKIF